MGPSSNYTGIDVVDKCVEETQERIYRLNKRNLNLSVQKMRNFTDFPEGDFDFVFGFSVFTHMELEDIYITLRELSQRTNIKGKLLFSFLGIEHEFGFALFHQESEIALEHRHNRVRNVAVSEQSIVEIGKRIGLEAVSLNWNELELPYSNGSVITNQSIVVFQK